MNLTESFEKIVEIVFIKTYEALISIRMPNILSQLNSLNDFKKNT